MQSEKHYFTSSMDAYQLLYPALVPKCHQMQLFQMSNLHIFLENFAPRSH